MDKYEKLEGKRVKYYYDKNDWVWGIVVNVDPDIGITVVREDDHKWNLVCLTGPSAPIWKSHMVVSSFTRDFLMMLEEIEEGKLMGFLWSGKNNYAGGVPKEFCPFNQ